MQNGETVGVRETKGKWEREDAMKRQGSEEQLLFCGLYYEEKNKMECARKGQETDCMTRTEGQRVRTKRWN